jgi:hypothetical protein
VCIGDDLADHDRQFVAQVIVVHRIGVSEQVRGARDDLVARNLLQAPHRLSQDRDDRSRIENVIGTDGPETPVRNDGDHLPRGKQRRNVGIAQTPQDTHADAFDSLTAGRKTFRRSPEQVDVIATSHSRRFVLAPEMGGEVLSTGRIEVALELACVERNRNSEGAITRPG